MSNQDNYNNTFNPGGRSPNSNGRYNGEIYKQNLNKDTDDDEIDLRQLFSVLLRYKYSIAVITIAVTIISGIIAFSILPVYQSDGSILITESQSRPLGGGGADLSSLLSTTYGIGMGSSLSNELQVFQSRKMSQALADNIISEDLMESGQRFPVLWRSYPEDSTVVTRDSVALRIRENMQVERVDRETDLVRV